MTNKPLLLVAAALAICLGDASADAAPTIIGTGVLRANSSTSNTGMLGNGTEFMLTNLTGFSDLGTGIFLGPPALPEQMFGTVTFNPGLNVFAINSPGFGLFDATSITEDGGGTRTRSWDMTGAWTPGNFTGFGRLTRGPKEAEFVLGMTTTGSASISASGTFAALATPSGVPEPSSLVMLLTGLAGAGFAGRKRRNRATRN